MEGSTALLLQAFVATAPHDPIWHWSGDNRGITHMRNQAIEATVHRWDAQNAQGDAAAIPSDIALDGIEQHFDVQIDAARHWGKPIEGNGERYHFHCTDVPGEWLITFQGGDVAVKQVHEKGDIAIRGSAQDLFLWLWGRIPGDRLEVLGDTALLQRYRQLVPSNS
jgi:predicted lipid carrier protein YhbT